MQAPADVVAAILAIGERLLQAQAAEWHARTVYRRQPTSDNMQRLTKARQAVEQLSEEYLASIRCSPSSPNREQDVVQASVSQ